MGVLVYVVVWTFESLVLEVDMAVYTLHMGSQRVELTGGSASAVVAALAAEWGVTVGEVTFVHGVTIAGGIVGKVWRVALRRDVGSDWDPRTVSEVGWLTSGAVLSTVLERVQDRYGDGWEPTPGVRGTYGQAAPSKPQPMVRNGRDIYRQMLVDYPARYW